MDDRFVVWDADGPAPAGAHAWNGYGEHSLLQYVESHGNRLRQKYLAWIHDLGESVVDALRIEEDFSYWWLTRLAEQSPWKSPAIADAIRFLALEEILDAAKPRRVVLAGGNRARWETLRGLCRALNIECTWERRPSREPRGFLKSLPEPVKAIGRLLIHVGRRWPLRRLRRGDWPKGVLFCAPFFHVVKEEAERGRFHSRFWEALPDFLRARGVNVNWLHLYYPHQAVPNARVAADWTKRFDGFHIFAESFLSAAVAGRVLRTWLKLLGISFKVRPAKAFRPRHSKLSLWPLMRREWFASMRGPAAMESLLSKELFDLALAAAPHQEKGVYLYENQAWERTFIHAWRKHGHGMLIGMAHSTIRDWDLRYFLDPRAFQSELPLPDAVAVNGKAAVESCISSGYPAGMIVECEAVRFGYLQRFVGQTRDSSQTLRVLILGDFYRASTDKMLEMIGAAIPAMTRPATFTVKPHPNAPVAPGRFEVVGGSLESMLSRFDAVFASNMTSAAVDAYCAGLRVVSMLDDAQLNFSPLRGRAGVRFVSTADELARALSEPPSGEPAQGSDYFFLDSELPRWSRLLT